ncbi:T-lymphocyte surface antigen Ly-9-like isoform X1 [Podarcis raffonei]|uniref:T-lymphocyte surface antigen Ly-9-like isoform X1 n=1 Tax=Podarcis raffonei TaxID=65483 RepID=UPI00232962EE|nr:T-lymphocyte surface antigen Ly-9-like isoform X1 [Podarcis raffonei]
MISKMFLHLWFLSIFMVSSGEENAEKIKGILGEPATFLLNTLEEIKKISWARTKEKQAIQIFVTAIRRKDPEERCDLTDQILAYRGRLSVSKDCKTLQINNLSQEDSGPYTAQIWIADDKDPIRETFTLMAYKRLLKADLEIVCDPKDYRGGNGTLQLNCSAGSWEDDATFSWASASMSESTGRSLVTRHNLEGNDLNFTCKVENPVSNASKTVSFLKICSEDKPIGSTSTVIWSISAVVVVIACAGLFMWWKKSGSHRKQLDSARQSESKECHTVYSQIENIPQNSPSETQQRRGPKAKKDVPQTIYTTVHLPKQNPLQTDDEKMRRTREKSEKTIYSEITKPQECEDQDSKTVYETVNNPRPPETTEYDKIL